MLVIGDLDPTGYIAVRSIEDRLNERADYHSGGQSPIIDVQHIALNSHEQVEELGIASACRETKAAKDADDNYTNRHAPIFLRAVR